MATNTDYDEYEDGTPRSVLSAWVRRVDPPQFVAEDLDELAGKEGEIIGLEQCDDCGGDLYRIVHIKNSWFAESVGHSAYKPFGDEDLEGDETEHNGCGRRWLISWRKESEVQF